MLGPEMVRPRNVDENQRSEKKSAVVVNVKELVAHPVSGK